MPKAKSVSRPIWSRWGGQLTANQHRALKHIADNSQPTESALVRAAVNLMTVRFQQSGPAGLAEFLFAPEVTSEDFA